MSDENMTTQEPVAVVQEDEQRKKRGGFWRFRDWLMGLTRRQRLLALIGLVAAALVIVLSILAWYLIFRKPITELPGVNLEIAPAYSYSIAGVQRPLGVAVDEEHNRVYVTQSDGTRMVKVFDIEGNPLGELLPPDDGFDHSSTYVALDPKTQNVYVADRGANQLYVYNPEGKYLRTVLPDTAKAWGPLGLTFDKDGLLYVADANAAPQKVWVLKTNGEVVRTFGETETLSFPNGLAVYDDGSVAVADSNHTQVLIYNADGTLRGKLAKGEADAALGMPRGLAIGAKNRLYVVDTTNAIVRVFKPGADDLPEFAIDFGTIGQRQGEFLYPNGIDTDEHGHIFVTDRENNRVQVWTNR